MGPQHELNQRSQIEPHRTEPKVSVAIPIFNEESVLPELVRRLTNVLDSIPGGPHEIVIANDGSSDGSDLVLEQLVELNSRLVVVSLSRNFGHQSAISAALDYSSGDVVVIMDGDLQDSPELIPRMLEEFSRGFDVVYTIRMKRKEVWWKRFCYAVFYRVIDSLADLRLPRGAGDFALLSRRVVDLMRLSPERHRYLRGLRTWYGFPQVGIEVERLARHSGLAKFKLRHLFSLAFDGIFAFSILPIRLAAMLGAFVVFCSICFAMYSLYAKFFFLQTSNQSPPGFTALIFAITFLGGMQLLFLGIVGEYIGRIYDEVKRRPHYVVKQVSRKN